MVPTSSILYETPSATAFVVDIPSSIALAQALPAQTSPPPPHSTPSTSRKSHGRRTLLSSAPLREPYPPSTEPKSEAARARVLERIPLSERHFHSVFIEPLVAEKLTELQDAFEVGAEWCLPRISIESDAIDVPATATQDDLFPSGKRKRSAWQRRDSTCPVWTVDPGYSSDWAGSSSVSSDMSNPPLILSPGVNVFARMSELCNTVVKNTSAEPAMVQIRCQSERDNTNLIPKDKQGYEQEHPYHYHSFYVPPLSHFLRCRIPISDPITQFDPIPGLPSEKKFNLILFDPPWTNRSVRRSGHYQTQSYLGWELLTGRLREILQVHLQEDPTPSVDDSDRGGIENTQGSIAAIWITNSAKARKAAYDAIQGAGITVCEEWVWLKTTTDGTPITALGGLWRKPYEILVIGRRVHPQAPKSDGGLGSITRRVIGAVPDVHSRKPNLKELFEKMFFSSSAGDRMPYSALEVFARNLTAGWWACGDDVLKFNSDEWWADDDI
ncbi:MT-A70-domain-containing protein [Aspergillus sclerotioniger CBS 115572]|uniref:MT-A70-domain-containing protein n=1 Tax=Aspergillus sclerotioniger CBS 115572 TaxID=1450535 RepID=A0A317V340_9EURO|nr:MT-A70-domain-containing protein [Aspergillus sclerotioniger CBS 115572]PWY67267.1 MT-A70-domain-containing protein [Aspergillus sclerotioniger CBS 115572]